MSPIFGPDNKPLPPAEPTPQKRGERMLDKLVTHYSSGDNWKKVEERFEALLIWLEPHFDHMHGMLCGTQGLDATTADGQILVKRLVDLANTALILRERMLREKDEQDDKVAENGGMKPDEHP